MAATDVAPESSEGQARLGLWACMALVVGNVIGVGIFTLPASLAAFGGLALARLAAHGGGALVLALVFARLSQLVPEAGGPYAYTRAWYRDFTGSSSPGATGSASGRCRHPGRRPDELPDGRRPCAPAWTRP